MIFELTSPTTALLASVGNKRPRPLLVTHRGERVAPYVVMVEKVIGHALPKGAEIHHIDNNPYNNAPSNLVVCPDAAYHKLLHQRQRAFAACGQYGWRKCQHCGLYDDPSRMWTSRKKAEHRACATAARRAARDNRSQKCSN